MEARIDRLEKRVKELEDFKKAVITGAINKMMLFFIAFVWVLGAITYTLYNLLNLKDVS